PADTSAGTSRRRCFHSATAALTSVTPTWWPPSRATRAAESPSAAVFRRSTGPASPRASDSRAHVGPHGPWPSLASLRRLCLLHVFPHRARGPSGDMTVPPRALVSDDALDP